jgi:hypothetical protein
MIRSSVVTFVLGILVTSLVYEVTEFRITGRPVSRVVASTQPTPASPAALDLQPRAASLPGPRPDNTDIERLRAEVSSLKGRAAFAEQQLEAAEGRATTWPPDVAPEYKRESVEQQLKELIVDRGLAKVKQIECSEYPCVEILQLPNTGPQAMQDLHVALQDVIKRYYNGKVALAISGSKVGNGSNAVSLAGVSIIPNDEDLKTRARHRANVGLQSYTE